MKHRTACVIVSVFAMVPGLATAPQETLPWKHSLKEAQEDARLRNVPILLYLGKDGIPT